jgi:NADH-quinone oxidoreductase subunit M
VLVGGIQERIHTRDVSRMGGLWATAPALSGSALFFSLASLGLPGMGDFVGEFLVLLGSWRVSMTITVVATIGILCSTFYALRMMQRAFFGPNANSWRLADLTPREGLMAGLMMASLLWLGLNPQPILNTFAPAMEHLQRAAETTVALLRR